MIDRGRGGSRTCSLHHAIPSISCSVVCTSLARFEHAVSLSRAPRYFLQRNILSRTQDTFVGQGFPSVRGYWPLCILLHHLFPQEVGL